MRIGFIVPDFDGGGAQQVVFRLATSFIERGHQSDLIVLRPTGPYLQNIPSELGLYHTAYPFYLRKVPGGRAFLADATRHGLVFERLFISPWRRHHAFRALCRRWPELHIPHRWAVYCASIAAYIRKNRPDVVFSAVHLANMAAVCGKALAGAETPLAVSLRSNLALDYSSDDLARARALYKEADAVVAVSNGVAEGAAKILDLKPERIITIHNPIPVAKIAKAATEPVDHPWFAEGEAPIVLTVGRPAPQKDHLTLIRAFALLRRSTKARLAILCDIGLYREKSTFLEAKWLATSLGIAEDVTYLDFDENPFRYMARAAVKVLSSRFEGFPNALLEAMACGTAVVSTDAPYGPAEILEEGRWGPLVPVGDADALAEALTSILAGQRVSAGELRSRASMFSVEKAVNKHEELFSYLTSH